MRHHRVEQLIVGERRIAEPQLVVGRALLPQRLAHGEPGGAEHFCQALGVLLAIYVIYAGLSLVLYFVF